VTTLYYLASCHELHTEEIGEVVACIEEESLLPPLIVVQVYIYIDVCIYICVYIYLYICVFIYV